MQRTNHNISHRTTQGISVLYFKESRTLASCGAMVISDSRNVVVKAASHTQLTESRTDVNTKNLKFCICVCPLQMTASVSIHMLATILAPDQFYCSSPSTQLPILGITAMACENSQRLSGSRCPNRSYPQRHTSRIVSRRVLS